MLLACLLAAAPSLGSAPTAAAAAEHVVRLVTEDAGGRFRFDPRTVFAQPGDRVRFEPDDGMHAVKSVAGMLPEGAAPFRGRMGEAVVVELDRPGVYGVKCRSGYEVGMVGLLVVGDRPPNWERAQEVRHPPTAAYAFHDLFAEAACRLHLPGCAD
jgi:pseudoazurin